MAIVVEDGTIVAGANSYLSVVAVTAFAAARGVTLSSTESVVEVQLIKAMDYIEAREALFVGCRKSEDQVPCWPRYYRGCDLLVPQKIRDAQGFLVMAAAAATPVNILPIGATLEPFPVTKKKLGPMEKAYQVPAGAEVALWPRVPAAEENLAFYYQRGGLPVSVY